MKNIDVDYIAAMLTEDPDIINEIEDKPSSSIIGKDPKSIRQQIGDRATRKLELSRQEKKWKEGERTAKTRQSALAKGEPDVLQKRSEQEPKRTAKQRGISRSKDFGEPTPSPSIGKMATNVTKLIQRLSTFAPKDANKRGVHKVIKREGSAPYMQQLIDQMKALELVEKVPGTNWRISEKGMQIANGEYKPNRKELEKLSQLSVLLPKLQGQAREHISGPQK